MTLIGMGSIGQPYANLGWSGVRRDARGGAGGDREQSASMQSESWPLMMVV